jgi:2-keto-4-pentenoate hydratase/2-oxohepta-3-ene-1,7-dioic acid hydratase in catechol pathway
MRVARYTTGQEPSYGIVQSDPDTMQSSWIAQIHGDPLYTPVAGTGNRVELEEVRLLAPVIPRSKIIGIGRNYAEHARELGHELPSEPLMFLVPNTAVIGPDDPVVIPPQTSECHYEGELAVVIGRMCKDVPAQQAASVIFGYTCANDVTAADILHRDATFPQWVRAKGFDTFCPIGPAVVQGLDPTSLRVVTRLNGAVRQDFPVSDMRFSVAQLVSLISQDMTLEPGDVILCGTSVGVGSMKPGSDVEVEIAGIGTLHNRFE